MHPKVELVLLFGNISSIYWYVLDLVHVFRNKFRSTAFVGSFRSFFQQQEFPIHEMPVKMVDIDAGGDYIASCLEDGKVILSSLVYL